MPRLSPILHSSFIILHFLARARADVTVICPLPPRLTPAQVTTTSDQARYAFIAPHDWKFKAVIDGREDPPVEWIVGPTITFSADGKHTAYVARDRRGARVVRNGQPGPRYESIESWQLSPAGALAYVSRNGRDMIPVAPSGPLPPAPRARLAALTDASTAFVLGNDAGERILLDGKEQPLYDQVADVVLAGAHHAYKARRGGKWLIGHDGKESRAYDDVSPPQLSPDGTRLAFAALREKQHLLVVDGVESRPYEYGELLPPRFSPDGKRTLATATRAGKTVVLIDGIETADHPWVHAEHRSFSSDSKRTAYLAGAAGGGVTLVVDGRPGPTFDSIESPTFSPDSKHIAFFAQRAGRWSLVKDATETPLTGTPDRLSFSPGGRHLAWLEQTRDGLFLVTPTGRHGPHLAIAGHAPLPLKDDGSLSVLAITEDRTAAPPTRRLVRLDVQSMPRN